MTAYATGVVRQFLRARELLDHPNIRSSHTRPTPRGGGLAILGVLVPVWATIFWTSNALDMGMIAVLAGAGVLAAIGWLDDDRGVSVGARLSVHALVVIAALAVAPAERFYFGGLLPQSLDTTLAAVAWIWFVNLYNFMDGIDGITGVETASIGLGTLGICWAVGMEGPLLLLGLTLAAGALGFLFWNWHPARVFLGDVGSVPLGFLAGWLLLELAARGQTIPVVIIPLYYIADASLTLCRRILNREKIWHAHRKHYYQQATRKGWRHDHVALIVAACNAALLILAVTAALGWVIPSAALAGGTIVATLWLLHDPREHEPRG